MHDAIFNPATVQNHNFFRHHILPLSPIAFCHIHPLLLDIAPISTYIGAAHIL